MKWQFVLVALLPVSLYNRSVLSADGAALCTGLVVIALCCRAASQLGKGRVWERSCWVTVCALTKQPQIVFVAMELMTGPLTRLARWKQMALVLVPSLLLSPLMGCSGRAPAPPANEAGEGAANTRSTPCPRNSIAKSP
jgi:hypothetical protein